MFCDEPLSQERWYSARTYDDAAWMIRRIWQDTKCPSVRKSQLFAIACARHVWDKLTDERLRRAIEIAERYADGIAARAEAEAAANVAFALFQDAGHNSPYRCLTNLVCIATSPRDYRFNDWKAPNTLRVLHFLHGSHTVVRELAASWIRDIFGNPFQPVGLDPSWSVWNNGNVVKLARWIYAERAFDHLPNLADVLEDAGCDDVEILGHCRQSKEHVRGCWVVDLLLGMA